MTRLSNLSAALALALALAAGTAPAQESARFDVRGTDIVQYHVQQTDRPTIEYYISQTRQPAPLVIFIQSSGCTPPFTGLGTPQRASHVFGYLNAALAGKYAVMVVTKPYSATLRVEGGTAVACPEQFNQYFTLESWTSALELALSHARHLPWVQPGPILAIGVSEGATAAALLAERDSRITHVAMAGGDGPTQFYDFVIGAYKAGGGDSAIKQRLDELEERRQQIFADPDSAKNFAWGHPYKRWASFFRASSTRSLLNSHAKVYLVSGMQDASVPILSTESLAAELAAAGHEVTLRRLPDAGHNLLPPGATFDTLWPEYQRILDWFQP